MISILMVSFIYNLESKMSTLITDKYRRYFMNSRIFLLFPL